MTEEGSEQCDLTIKWTSKEIKLALPPTETVATLKRELEKHTEVQVKRQKLLLKTKAGKLAEDVTLIADLAIKPNQKIVMMGTAEKVLETLAAQAEVQPHVQDDFEDDQNYDVEVDPRRRPEILEKLEKRVKGAIIKRINDPRPGKKALVIDIDYTFYALDSFAENPMDLARPYLDEFFEVVYANYDIVVWSATGMKWIEVKLKELGVSNNPNYKIMACMDYTAMVTVESAEKGVFDCKPLEVFWRNFEQYSPKNTIMLDDLRRNYCLNPQSGLVIRPYRKAHRMKQTDKELLHLKIYLTKIAALESFEELNHDKWEKYIKYELRELAHNEQQQQQE